MQSSRSDNCIAFLVLPAELGATGNNLISTFFLLVLLIHMRARGFDSLSKITVIVNHIAMTCLANLFFNNIHHKLRHAMELHSTYPLSSISLFNLSCLFYCSIYC